MAVGFEDSRQRTFSARQEFSTLPAQAFDAVIVGGGIQGACIYHYLSQQGHRVLLVDRGDFASGTSQSSAMLIWGGFLYLRNADILEVCRLSAARERILAEQRDWVRPHSFRYIFARPAHRPQWLIHSALWVYWLLGGCRRHRPMRQRDFAEAEFLDRSQISDSVIFQEGQLRNSDSNFVLHWLLSGKHGNSRAINYCAVVDGGYDPSRRVWQLDLKDTICGSEMRVSASWVINAAGIWTDSLNARFGIQTPYKHALSKGVSFTFPRHPAHRDTLAFDSRKSDEGLSLVPWGPVSLWGSTETLLPAPQAVATAEVKEMEYLLNELNAHLRGPVVREDIISLRCGTRPLAVPKSFTSADPLDMSRRALVYASPDRPWLSIFGGKITGCTMIADEVARLLRRQLPRPHPSHNGATPQWPNPPTIHFAPLGMPIPSPQWCRMHTQCRTLEDYLRRRTNIAQWLPRGGLGRANEYADDLLHLARALYGNDDEAAAALQRYQRQVEREIDSVLSPARRPVTSQPVPAQI